MFRRLPEATGAAHPRHHRRQAGEARAGDSVAAAHAGGRPRSLPHDGRVGRAARALLHDGRVLRLPGHDRRHRQPAGLPRRRCGKACASRRSTAGGWRNDGARAGAAKAAYDVAIVGAGPAGLAAAATTARRRPRHVCCSTRSGARRADLPRHHHDAASRSASILGEDYWPARGSWPRFEGERRRDTCRARRYGASSREREIGVSPGGGSRLIRPARVILATGALERPFPIPGWTLPGVMTAGAAQTLLKSSGLVPDGRMVLAGTGPLLWLFAAQLLRAGGTHRGACSTRRHARNTCARLPHAAGFLALALPRQGAAPCCARCARKVRIVRGVTQLRAEGNGRLAEVAYVAGSGAEQRMHVDVLVLHQGVVPNVNLAMAAGIAHRWDPMQLCWTPVLDAARQHVDAGIADRGRRRGHRRRARGRGARPSRGAGPPCEAVAPERVARFRDQPGAGQAAVAR